MLPAICAAALLTSACANNSSSEPETTTATAATTTTTIEATTTEATTTEATTTTATEATTTEATTTTTVATETTTTAAGMSDSEMTLLHERISREAEGLYTSFSLSLKNHMFTVGCASQEQEDAFRAKIAELEIDPELFVYERCTGIPGPL